MNTLIESVETSSCDGFISAIQSEAEMLKYTCDRISASSCGVSIPSKDRVTCVIVTCLGGHSVEIKVDGCKEIRKDFDETCSDSEAANEVVLFIIKTVNDAMNMFKRNRESKSV